MLKRFLLMTAFALCMLVPAGRLLAKNEVPAAAEEHAAVAEHAAAAEGQGEHAKPPLLPDPTKSETLLSALWVVIIFVVLLAVLYPTAWKGVLAGLKAREERIRKDIADAEASRQRAEATLREYNQQLATAEQKVRELLTQATTDGQKLADNIRATAQKEAEQIKDRTTRDIEAAKQQAVQEIHTYTADLAVRVAEKILRKTLTPEDQKELLRTGLEQLQSVSKN